LFKSDRTRHILFISLMSGGGGGGGGVASVLSPCLHRGCQALLLLACWLLGFSSPAGVVLGLPRVPDGGTSHGQKYSDRQRANRSADDWPGTQRSQRDELPPSRGGRLWNAASLGRADGRAALQQQGFWGATGWPLGSEGQAAHPGPRLRHPQHRLLDDVDGSGSARQRHLTVRCASLGPGGALGLCAAPIRGPHRPIAGPPLSCTV
jgi:hypothetical protein